MEHDLDVLVICEVNVDIVVTGLLTPPEFGAEHLVDHVGITAGSSGVLTATGLAALGARVGVCGLVGDDVFGHYMLDHLDRWGIDRTGVVVDQSLSTGASVSLSMPGDRAIVTSPGAMAGFTTAQIPAATIDRARHIHISSYFLQTSIQPGIGALLVQARRKGSSVSADIGHDPAERWDTGSLLSNVDVFLPNDVEASAMTGCPDAEAALEQLAARIPCIAVKRGKDGALAARGSERVSVPGFPIQVVDTTGAGDAFDAGFLRAWLAGKDLETCVREGNACGALTTAHVGGAGAISVDRVRELITGNRAGVSQ